MTWSDKDEDYESTESVSHTSHQEMRKPFHSRFIDSFKPAIVPEFDTTGMTAEEIRNHKMAAAPMAKGLSTWQISMMAIGGSIGSGLFVSTGNDLAEAGPGGTIIGFVIVGVMLFFMMHSMGEVSVRFPRLNLVMQSDRLLDDSVAFSMCWIYFLNWAVSFPLELVASAIIIQYWDSPAAQDRYTAGWVALFWVVLFIVGCSGVRVYGHSEAVMSFIKVVAILGFCIFGIVCAAGGGPTHHYFGTHYWFDPGSFNYETSTAAKNTMNVFISAAFAMSGIELAGVASTESKYPQKSLPKAVRQTMYRVTLFYIVSLVICFCLVPWTDPRLGTSETGNGSPFVLAIVNAGVGGLPSVFNVVILLSALSVANAAIYGSSRTLAAIAHAGGAPQFVGYVDRAGRPMVAIIVTMIFGLIGFVVAAPHYQKAFDWMQAISGQVTLFIWGFICLNHILFRIAMKKQGRSLNEQFYSSPFGIIGSAIGLAIILAILGLEMWIAIWPPGATPEENADGKGRAYDFFVTWLSLPIAIAFFAGHKLWYRRKPVHPSTMDLMTDANIKTEKDYEEEAQELVEWNAKSPMKRFGLVILRWLC